MNFVLSSLELLNEQKFGQSMEMLENLEKVWKIRSLMRLVVVECKMILKIKEDTFVSNFLFLIR